MAKVSRELNQTMLAKTTGYLRHSRLGIDNHSLGERVKSPDTGSSPRPALIAKSVHEQGHRTKVPFVLSSGPLRKAWVVLTLHAAFWICPVLLVLMVIAESLLALMGLQWREEI